MQLTQDMAQKKLADMRLDDMPVVAIRPVSVPVPNDWVEQYKNLRKKFLMSLSDSITELSFMNLTQDEFINMLTHGKLPTNTSIRFRVPLIWGGKLSIDNLFMCSTFPISNNLDRFIIEQTGNETIWLPNPEKKIYVPTHTGGGGDGGNVSSDRISQVAAQMMAGNRGMN